MTRILRTNFKHPDFVILVDQLNRELAVIDGEDHAFYSQYNALDKMNHVILLYESNQPVGCGALKEYDKQSVEVKRMYTTSSHRGKGLATLILQELERWAQEENYTRCILETGQRQQDAVALYVKNGYSRIPNYGPYKGVQNSLCFEKKLVT